MALRAYSIAVYLFLYVPIGIIVLFSFNSGRHASDFRGFSVEWYGKAVELGNRASMYELARLYENGHGIRASWSDALDWYSRSARVALAEGDRSFALHCYERMSALAPEHDLTRELRRRLPEVDQEGPRGQ